MPRVQYEKWAANPAAIDAVRKASAICARYARDGYDLTLRQAGRPTMDSWMYRALCRTRPAEWWDFGDPGNRLALALCRRACPVFEDCTGRDPAPAGVVRAGVAWTDAGKPAQMCACGRPITPKSGRQTGRCATCDVPNVWIPPRRRGRPRRVVPGPQPAAA